MSKRLQVIFGDAEYRELQSAAKRSHLTVSEWVRQSLRELRRREPLGDSARKLSMVREAARHRFPIPAPPIETMLDEIERGYLGKPTS